MRLPYINLRWLIALLVVVLAAAGGVAGWLWYNGRPDKVWESANDYFQQGEKLRGAGNPAAKPTDDDRQKARVAYEHARTLNDYFIKKAQENKDPRLAQANMLGFKILWPMAGLAAKPEDAAAFQNEAFRYGKEAARLDEHNIEAQAVMVFDNFRKNDFASAYPYARTLIDNLTPEKEKQVQLDDFNDYVMGAYYVLSLKDLQNNHPEDAIKDVEAGLAREKTDGSGRREPRWRSVLVEVQALQKKAEMAGRDQKAAKAAEDRLKAVLGQAVDRAREELKQPADGKADMPRVASMSLTNASGMIDVLLTSVQKADSHQAVAERAQVLLDVCDKMASTPGAAPHIYQNAVRGASRLVFLNGGLHQGNRLAGQELADAQARAVAINESVQKNGGTIDPTAYLEMSRTAMQQSPKERSRALELAKRGLKVAADQHIPADDKRVVALEAQAAWLLLLDRNIKDAEEYLTLIAKQQQLKPDVAYMRGLGAVLDGRLEDGVQYLSEAAQSARFKDNLPLLLGLAHAYLGMGQVENAAPVLQDIIGIRRTEAKKNRDDEPWINIWQPSLEQAVLDLMKCDLALALKSNDKNERRAYADRAGALFNELKNGFLASDAQAAVLNYDLTRLRALEAKDPNSIEADVLRGRLEKTVAELPPAMKGDARIVWAQVNMILGRKETNPAVIGGAVAAPLGAPTDLAVRLGEMGRLRAGYAWQVEKAEEYLRKAAAEQRDSVGIQLAWANWLVNNGRPEEALANLAEMEERATTDKDRLRVQTARARIFLSQGKKDEADVIIRDMRPQAGKDASADLLYIWELILSGDPKADAEITKLLGKEGQSGLVYFIRGVQAQVKGEYVQAIQAYERAMEYTQFRSRAESSLMACILGIQNGPPGKPEKANPEAALKEARRLRQAHPRVVGVQLAFAVTARVMDEVYGDDGMEGALNDMMRLLVEEKTSPETGPYVAAQQWIAAGRTDVARDLLRGNRKHAPSLALATQLAVADEDWAEVAADLKLVGTVVPDAIDLPLWRGALHEAKGERKEAEEIYTKFIDEHPKLNTGYLAMARLHERAKEYKEALGWVKKWRDKMPEEVNGINALVRVLAEDGQAAEASKEAEAFIKSEVARAKAAREEWEAKNPITEKDKDKAKAEADERAKVREAVPESVGLTLALGFVGVFEQARAYAEADKWLSEKCMPVLDKLPEDAKKKNHIALTMLRASIAMSRGRQLPPKDPARAALMDRAMKAYDEVYQQVPGDLVSGNNLAYLLVKEKGEPTRAVALVDEVRKGKYSRKPISPERLPLEFLDTIGIVYHAAGMNQESLELFKQATDKHYTKEPRLIMYTGLAQEGLQRRADAIATFNLVVNLAETQAKTTADPDRKELLTKLSEDAKAEQRKMK